MKSPENMYNKKFKCDFVKVSNSLKKRERGT